MSGPGRPPPAAPGGRRLGEPIELPWWVLPLSLPPAAALVLGLAVHAPLSARLVDLAGSAAMLWVLYAVARRVGSRNLQSVWISAAYAFWLFAVLIWAVQAFA